MAKTFIKNVANRMIEPIIDLFFPPVCFLCDALLKPTGKIVCLNCFSRLERYISETTEFSAEKFLFGHLFILYEYSDEIRHLIHLIKYQNRRGLAGLFAREAAEQIQRCRTSAYDVIIPVPLHRRRFRERGYNQSEEIARHLAEVMESICVPDQLTRNRNTATQTRFSKQERIRNVFGAFECHSDLRGKRVLLIDDVITTGSTVNECCSALLQAGADAVDVLALANPRLDA